MDQFYQQLSRYRIIPVVKIDNLAAADPLFEALTAGGLPLAEITLRTDCALEVIRQGSARSDFIIGAGTVLNVRDCDQALRAGASFVVSPGFDHEVVELCARRGIPCLPGAATASEIQHLYNRGVLVAKFFPAEPLGGVNMLKALAAPFRQMQFVPTGGIQRDNLRSYLSLPCVTAVGGSWMVHPDLYQNGDFSFVTQAVKDALQLV